MSSAVSTAADDHTHALRQERTIQRAGTATKGAAPTVATPSIQAATAPVKADRTSVPFLVYILALVGVAAWAGFGPVGFGAAEAVLFVLVVTIGYLLSRGLRHTRSTDFIDDGRRWLA